MRIEGLNAGSVTEAFSFVDFFDPRRSLCGTAGAVQNTTGPRSADFQ
jgi:hypothetical protein